MIKDMMRIISLVLIVTLTISCNNYKGEKKMDESIMFGRGSQAPQDYFSHMVWVKMLLTDEEKIFDTQVYNVTFEPQARTHWHSHPGGQILLVTRGTGYYQEKGQPAQILNEGDVVPIPPDVMHWHGASPENAFVHLGLSTKVHVGPAEWYGPVTDQEYDEATSNKEKNQNSAEISVDSKEEKNEL